MTIAVYWDVKQPTKQKAYSLSTDVSSRADESKKAPSKGCEMKHLILKAPTMAAADDTFCVIFSNFSKK